MQKNKFLYSILLSILSINTIMICMLTYRSIDDRKTLVGMQVEIQELKRRVEIEIKLRQEILPEIKKSSALLSNYNPDLDPATARSYAIKIWQCSDAVVPHDLLTALIVVESSANQNAKSSRGALGLTQIIPSQWDYEYQALKNPYKNIEAGADILRQSIKRHGLIGGLQVYNCGTFNPKSQASLKFAKKVLLTAESYF